MTIVRRLKNYFFHNVYSEVIILELKEAISIVIKQERKKNGMSQEELAHLCNIDRTYISLLERKKRNPTLDVIFKMSNSFNIKPSNFVKMLEDTMHFS